MREADIAVDFVPDELESKLEIFCLVDRMAPPKTMSADAERGAEHYRSGVLYLSRRAMLRGARRDWICGRQVRLLHPAGAKDDGVEVLCVDFLRALGCEVRVEVDGDAPKLVKNLG